MALLAACGQPAQAPVGTVTVFAAASLKNVLDELSGVCGQTTGAALRMSYAASSTLARQIEAQADADVFVSADEEWMDYVMSRGLMQPATRVSVAGNRLVLIAPRDSTQTLTISAGMPIAQALGTGRLALADPAAVPAGKYARAALSSLGVWNSVADRIAPAENVRAALLLVSRGEAPLGIVYQTDAAADAGVRVVATFPESLHPPIVYPAAVTARGGDLARRVLACLRDLPAQSVFLRHGFLAPPHGAGAR
jgi:molybdate transport system substrate-binding protein